MSPERRSEIALGAARARWGEPKRRTPERARREGKSERIREAILASAERWLIAGGPEALRLQAVGAEAGISQAGILYHFGSRAGLLEALTMRAARKVQEGLVAGMGGDGPPRSLSERTERTLRNLEAAWDTFGKRGYARLIAALVLSGRDDWRDSEGAFEFATRAFHESRLALLRAEGRPLPSYEDTCLLWILIGSAIVGDALAGRLIREHVRFPTGEEGTRRFLSWLAHAVEALPPIFEEEAP